MRLTIHKDVAPEDWATCVRTAAKFVAEFPETHWRRCAYSTNSPEDVTVFVHRTKGNSIAVRLERRAAGEDRP
jgi:hypothetical protein